MPVPVAEPIASLREMVLLTLELVLKLQERDVTVDPVRRERLGAEIEDFITFEINPRIAAWDEIQYRRGESPQEGE